MRNVFFLFLFFTLYSCTGQTGNSAKMTPDDFEKGLSKSNVQILDVRRAAEFNNGHLKNALLADWTNPNEFFDRIQFLDKDKPVYVYCLSEGRSSAAAKWMRENGFQDVNVLKGGINAWKMASKPLEGNKDLPQMSVEQYNAQIPINKTTLVDIGAPWCPPCVKMAPVIESLKTNKDLNFELINVDAGVHTELLKALEVEPIPVFIIYKNGKETWRKQGIVSKEELIANIK
jgi:rhodanese-related sulfurtransferase/glutaredoxin